MRAREAGMGTSAIPYLGEQRVDRGIDSEPLSEAPRRVSRGTETVEQRLEPFAHSEMSTAPDSLSDSGVRHLRVEVQEQSTGRWRIIRLRATPSDMVDSHSS